MRTLVVIPAYNEAGKIGRVVSGIPRDAAHEVLVIDDGSVDATPKEALACGAKVISKTKKEGVGSAIRTGIEYAVNNGFFIVVIMAGNSKDSGSDIAKLTRPIITGRYDFVQGSRFLNGGDYAKMPLYRLLATKYLHPLLFSFFTGRMITDSTNGFRAIRLEMIKDRKLDLNQDWLDRYELEPYLFFKAIRMGYRVTEVGVSKIYPARRLGYTKMRPIIDWWLILKPVFLLGLGIKK